jgi:uroporphyrinogen-III synthase
MRSADLPLAGRTVVVTRAAEQGHRLRAALERLGADVIELPLIEVVGAIDGGAALREAWAQIDRYDWLIVTSPNGAARVAPLLAAHRPGGLRIAAIGEATASDLGPSQPVDLLPRRSVAEGLLDDLASYAAGRALVVQGDRARATLVDGLRAAGWDVDPIVAYRTVATRPAAELLRMAAAADAITFASGSTVESYVEAAGPPPSTTLGARSVVAVPPVVVSIGPATTAVAERLGVRITATADPHTLDGLVAALVGALGGDG